METKRGLYIHIPFCNQICSYCDFPKFMASQEKKKKYIDKLIAEIKEIKDAHTIYIGGGTPNSLSLEDFERLLDATSHIKPLEFTIELNPELITIDQIKLLKKYGVNRVSIGVQTINNSLLKTIRRCHTKEIVFNKIELIRANGITNINADFIFAIPGQTLEDLKKDLDFLLSLKLPHISYYSLIPEEKTILDYQLKKGEIKLIDEESEAIMYEFVIDTLKKNGYHHYEISNFSYPGYECVHNQIYWHNEEYFGLGLGAAGYINHVRYTNSFTMKGYFENQRTSEYINKHEALCEEMMLGLRLIDGIDINAVENKYQISLFKTFSALRRFIDDNLLKIDSGRLKLTSKGLLLGNEVFEIFVGGEDSDQ